MPRLGQGTWMMGEGRQPVAEEVAALQLGLDLGMTLIDTAEMYGDGASETVVGQAIAGRRDAVYLVSKVLPHHASQAGLVAACEHSLRRLKTDYLDLYLLHWRGQVPLAETVAGFEALRSAGHIRAWGVSNFDVADMQTLARITDRCAANQVLYNLEHRGIEYDLLLWCQDHACPVMAYSPVGQGGALLRHPALATVAAQRETSPAQIALAWAMRQPGVVAIPKSGRAEHVRANAAAAALALTEADCAALDAAFAPPHGKQPLAML